MVLVTAGATTEPPASHRIDVRLGKKIGEGANSEVYECSGDVGDATVAKVSKPMDPSTLEVATARLERLVALPPHQNVTRYARVLRAFPAPEQVTVLLKRYAGDAFHYLMRKRPTPLPMDLAVQIGHQLACGLLHLHSQKIVHGDVSLRNILVEDFYAAVPRVAVADLEEAIISGFESTNIDDLAYTAEFAAPERHRGIVTEKTDVFSLGVVLYELASRHPSEYPGMAQNVPGVPSDCFFSMVELTPTRIAAVVHRDLAEPGDEHASLASLITLMLNHDHTTRVSMDFVLSVLETIRNKGQLAFPTCLRPISAVRLAPREAAKVQLYSAAGLYDIMTECVLCGRQRHAAADPKHRSECRDSALHMPGHLSPGLPYIPSPLAALLIAGGSAAPARAQSCEFLYPMTDMEPRDDFELLASESDQLEALQLHGGFCVKQSAAAAADILVLHEDRSSSASAVRIVFTAAQPWPSECTMQLHCDARIHGPIPAFLGTQASGSTGARAQKFAWILPNETFVLQNGEVWMPSPDGAFVFWFNDDPLKPHSLDRMFAIVPTVEKQSRAALPSIDASTPAAPPASTPRTPSTPIASRAVAATFAAAGAAVQMAAAASSVLLRSAVGGSTEPIGALPISVWICKLPNSAITLTGESQFRVSSTGEEGDCSPVFMIGQSVAQALQLPSNTTGIRICTVRKVTESRPAPEDVPRCVDQLMPHHGVIGVSIRGDIVAVLSFRIVIETIPGATAAAAPVAPSSLGGFKLRTVIPRTDSIVTEYRGNVVPAEIRPVPGAADAVNTTPAVAFVGWEIAASSLKFYFALADHCSSWQVRSLKT